MAIKSHQEPSRAIKMPSRAIESHLEQSSAIKRNQWQSSAIKRHQWQSRAFKGHDLHVAQMFVEDGARRLARGARHLHSDRCGGFVGMPHSMLPSTLHRRIELIPQRRVLARLRRGGPGRGGSG
jgi:hypothetical protein